MAILISNYPASLDTISTLGEVSNRAKTTLAVALVSTGEIQISLSNASGFPNTGVITIDNEIFYYSSKTANILTIEARAQQGTVAAAHLIGALVYLRLTKGHWEVLRTSVINTQTKLGFGAGSPTANTWLKGTGVGVSTWSTLSKSDVGLANVQNVDQTNAANLTSGIVGTVRLGSGTANISTFLRGDNTWQVVSAATPRVTLVLTSTNPQPNTATEDLYDLYGQAVSGNFEVPLGTPVNGQKLMIRIKDDGIARSITWNAVYVSGGPALPTATVAGNTMHLGFIYNTNNGLNKWMLVAYALGYVVAAPSPTPTTIETIFYADSVGNQYVDALGNFYTENNFEEAPAPAPSPTPTVIETIFYADSVGNQYVDELGNFYTENNFE